MDEYASECNNCALATKQEHALLLVQNLNLNLKFEIQVLDLR